MFRINNVLISISSFISQLFEDKDDEILLISKITEIATTNRYQYREICQLIINRFKSEHSSEKRKKIINIIDSLIKTFNQDYINIFSPYLYELFTTTFFDSPDNVKLHLFKIYYTWKHFINPSILSDIQNQLQLDIMKYKIAEKDPKLIERYDKYNDDIKLSFQSRNIYMQMNDNTPQAKSKNNIRFNRDRDSLVKDVSNDDVSVNKEKIQGKDKGSFINNSNKIKNRIRVISKGNDKEKKEEGSNNVAEQEKTQNIIKMKKFIQQNQEKPHYNNSNNLYNVNKSNSNKSNSNSDMLNKKRNPSPNSSQTVNKVKTLRLNFSKNFQKKTPKDKSNHSPIEAKTTEVIVYSQPNRFDNILSSFLDKNYKAINPSMNFFSSISKNFTEAYIKSDKLPTLKTGKDLFISKDLFPKIYEYSKILFHSLRNICPICGLRTKFYSRFVEHLDIHFHYSYLKYTCLNSNKVLCRKEGCNKESWITNSYLRVGSSYTLNAILFYKNNSDNTVSNQIVRLKEKEENNEDIYPIGREERSCYYCGEPFRKQYFTEYHFWFYINAVKAKNEYINKDILLHKNCIEEYTQYANN